MLLHYRKPHKRLQIRHIRERASTESDLSLLERVYEAHRNSAPIMCAWSRKLASLAVDCTDDLRTRLVARSDTVLDAMRFHSDQAPIVENCARFLSVVMSVGPWRRSWRQCWLLLLKLTAESIAKDSKRNWGLRRVLARIVLSLREGHEDLRADSRGMAVLSDMYRVAQADCVDVPGLDAVHREDVEPWLVSQVSSQPTVFKHKLWYQFSEDP